MNHDDPHTVQNERRRRVLSALVQEYIVSATPVGSRTLVEHYELGCSPATVRSVLSQLEESGHVEQPHISAGRIPTDNGYRCFVDELLETEPRDEFEGELIDEVQIRASELDDLIDETSAALTRLTDCLALVFSPSVALARVKRINAVSLAPHRFLFVVITDDGRVVNRTAELEFSLSPDEMLAEEERLNETCAGLTTADLRVAAAAHGRSDVKEAASVATRFSQAAVVEIVHALDDITYDRIHQSGIPALLSQPEFQQAARVAPLFATLEAQLALLDVFADSWGAADTIVKIGHENKNAALAEVSIVASPYGSESDGLVAVLGPTRMNYARAITAVRLVSDILGDALR